MSAQRALGTPSISSSNSMMPARRGLVNAGSPTKGLGFTHGLAPLFAAANALLPAKVRGTLVKR